MEQALLQAAISSQTVAQEAAAALANQQAVEKARQKAARLRTRSLAGEQTAEHSTGAESQPWSLAATLQFVSQVISSQSLSIDSRHTSDNHAGISG